ncbi:MAG: DUF72 domain-containing protein [Actinomycetota bacterium]|nr:DUF72 domain-containing protein [Actinomycetota bacterium]
MSELRVGTSGWRYKHWKGRFYPKDLPISKWLEHYTRAFDTVELNNPFYRQPEKKTFEKWRRSVPDDFVYAVKLNRFVTGGTRNDRHELVRDVHACRVFGSPDDDPAHHRADDLATLRLVRPFRLFAQRREQLADLLVLRRSACDSRAFVAHRLHLRLDLEAARVDRFRLAIQHGSRDRLRESQTWWRTCWTSPLVDSAMRSNLGSERS